MAAHHPPRRARRKKRAKGESSGREQMPSGRGVAGSTASATAIAARTAAPPLAVPPSGAEQMLNVSHKKLYELLRDGELESFTIGRARRITVRSIHALIERGVSTARASGALLPLLFMLFFLWTLFRPVDAAAVDATLVRSARLDAVGRP